jgi:predicted RNA-binding Zn ribbon-like protein
VARQVDGIWLPARVSGHPALELNNTIGGWRYPQPREYLIDYRAFVTLARDLELVSASESRALLAAAATPHAREVLREIRRLRGALHAVALADSANAAAELHQFVMTAVRASRYTRDHAGVLRLDGGTGLRMPLHRFALSLSALLEQHPRSAIRACADEQCGWLFLDPSGRRRWCEMAVCGNRAKARRYAKRHDAREAIRPPPPNP